MYVLLSNRCCLSPIELTHMQPNSLHSEGKASCRLAIAAGGGVEEAAGHARRVHALEEVAGQPRLHQKCTSQGIGRQGGHRVETHEFPTKRAYALTRAALTLRRREDAVRSEVCFSFAAAAALFAPLPLTSLTPFQRERDVCMCIYIYIYVYISLSLSLSRSPCLLSRYHHICVLVPEAHGTKRVFFLQARSTKRRDEISEGDFFRVASHRHCAPLRLWPSGQALARASSNPFASSESGVPGPKQGRRSWGRPTLGLPGAWALLLYVIISFVAMFHVFSAESLGVGGLVGVDEVDPEVVPGPIVAAWASRKTSHPQGAFGHFGLCSVLGYRVSKD